MIIGVVILAIVSFVCGFLAGKYMGHLNTIERLADNKEIDAEVFKREMKDFL